MMDPGQGVVQNEYPTRDDLLRKVQYHTASCRCARTPWPLRCLAGAASPDGVAFSCWSMIIIP
jgi:hypothetical protein